MLPCLMGLRAILSKFSRNRKKAQRLLLKPGRQVSLRTGIKFVSVDPPPVNSPVWEPASDSLGFICPICHSLSITPSCPAQQSPWNTFAKQKRSQENKVNLVLTEFPLHSIIPAWEGRGEPLDSWPGVWDPHIRPKTPSLLARSGDGFKGPRRPLIPAQ